MLVSIVWDSGSSYRLVKEKGLQNTGAPILRYQAGNPSKPVAVGFRVSRILNTCQSVIYTKSAVAVVCFLDGLR